MSLALVQAYSSEDEVQARFSDSESEEEEEEREDGGEGSTAVLEDDILEGNPSVNAIPPPSSTQMSPLPSAATIFSEVTGPPEFLKDTVGAAVTIQPRSHSRYGSKVPSNSQTRKVRPAGVVVEAKPQVGDLTVRGDQDTKKEEARKPPTAGMPPAEDAAKLLGVCLQCSVPKTYSAAKEGLVCPLCKDRPAIYNDADFSKRRGSKIKEKEKSKRMKGQSSHATWKSETEMHLRQQFD